MKTLLVQDYLRSGKSLEDLKRDHGIKYSIKNHKVTLNYHQLNSSETDPLACQCRGLILSLDNYDIIAYPMDRFFNHGQFDHNTDLTNFKVLEKLDGSCCIVYYDHFISKWCLGTRNTPEGSAEVNSGFSILEIFEQTIKHISKKDLNLQDLMFSSHKENTYVFELCSIHNRIVCEYLEPKLFLLAVRNNQTLEEQNPAQFIMDYVELPKSYSFSSFKELVELVNSWDAKEHEGVVLVNDNFYRLKFKNQTYIIYNKLHDQLDCVSMRNTIRLILSEKDDDVFAMLDPYNQKKLTWLKGLIKDLIVDIQKEYDQFTNVHSQKEFAELVKLHKYCTVFFKMRKGKELPNALFEKDVMGMFNDSIVDSVISLLKKRTPNLEELNVAKMYSF